MNWAQLIFFFFQNSSRKMFRCPSFFYFISLKCFHLSFGSLHSVTQRAEKVINRCSTSNFLCFFDLKKINFQLFTRILINLQLRIIASAQSQSVELKPVRFPHGWCKNQELTTSRFKTSFGRNKTITSCFIAPMSVSWSTDKMFLNFYLGFITGEVRSTLPPGGPAGSGSVPEFGGGLGLRFCYLQMIRSCWRHHAVVSGSY